MIASRAMARRRETYLKGQLYRFLAKLMENAAGATPEHFECSKQEFYIRNAVEYIRMNYSRKITVNQIARYIGLDRSYLVRRSIALAAIVFYPIFNIGLL
jgi:AraC-like DNA-binding protein